MMEQKKELLEKWCKDYEKLVEANNIRMENEPLNLATYEASILFGDTVKENEIQNIDELCETVDLEENSAPVGVHIQILRSE